jgi:hypothetical protein
LSGDSGVQLPDALSDSYEAIFGRFQTGLHLAIGDGLGFIDLLNGNWRGWGVGIWGSLSLRGLMGLEHGKVVERNGQ